MNFQQIENYSRFVKASAARLGFDYCGIAKAEQLDDDARRLEQWLLNGYHGGMSYMERYFDLRIDPRKLVPNAKSVITLMMNYYPKEQQNADAPKISKYAFGIDYHELIKDKLNEFLVTLRDEIGEINGRGFVDSAPVLERAWAQRSGLGWIGKNNNLLTRNAGSFFFIASLIVDLPLVYDAAFAKDFCGSCTRCIDACPTGAIPEAGVIDGSKCISYLTIEMKDEIFPEQFKGEMEGWMFGCDICQDVCPWNRFAKPHQKEELQPIPEILNLSTSQWQEMDQEIFNKLLKHSPIKRSKWKGIQRNLTFLSNE